MLSKFNFIAILMSLIILSSISCRKDNVHRTSNLNSTTGTYKSDKTDKRVESVRQQKNAAISNCGGSVEFNQSFTYSGPSSDADIFIGYFYAYLNQFLLEEDPNGFYYISPGKITYSNSQSDIAGRADGILREALEAAVTTSQIKVNLVGGLMIIPSGGCTVTEDPNPGGGGEPPIIDPVAYPADPATVVLPQNKLCATTFSFSTVVEPDPSQGSRGWKESAVKDLSINVLPDSYLENIWDIVTTGSIYTSAKFNLTIGAPGDLPNAQLAQETALAANITMVQIEKSYGHEGLKTLILTGLLPQKIAQLMQIQLQAHIPGARVSSSLNGNTPPRSPITGTNCN